MTDRNIRLEEGTQINDTGNDAATKLLLELQNDSFCRMKESRLQHSVANIETPTLIGLGIGLLFGKDFGPVVGTLVGLSIGEQLVVKDIDQEMDQCEFNMKNRISELNRK